MTEDEKKSAVLLALTFLELPPLPEHGVTRPDLLRAAADVLRVAANRWNGGAQQLEEKTSELVALLRTQIALGDAKERKP